MLPDILAACRRADEKKRNPVKELGTKLHSDMRTVPDVLSAARAEHVQTTASKDHQTPDTNILVPVTSTDLDRFHRNARTALAQRAPHIVLQQIAQGFQSVLFGVIPVVGLLFLEWRAYEMIVYLILGFWIETISDILKVRFIRKALIDSTNRSYDDYCVWSVVKSLRAAEAGHERWQTGDHPPADEQTPRVAKRWMRSDAGEPPYAFGALVDGLFGGVATLLTYRMLATSDPGFLDIWVDVFFLAGLLPYVAAKLWMTVWEIHSHRHADAPTAKVTVTLGLRGVGLFFFMFLVLLSTGGGLFNEGVRDAMAIVYSLTILVGLFNISAPLRQQSETRWLRHYLKEWEAGNVTWIEDLPE